MLSNIAPIEYSNFELILTSVYGSIGLSDDFDSRISIPSARILEESNQKIVLSSQNLSLLTSIVDNIGLRPRDNFFGVWLLSNENVSEETIRLYHELESISIMVNSVTDQTVSIVASILLRINVLPINDMPTITSVRIPNISDSLRYKELFHDVFLSDVDALESSHYLPSLPFMLNVSITGTGRLQLPLDSLWGLSSDISRIMADGSIILTSELSSAFPNNSSWYYFEGTLFALNDILRQIGYVRECYDEIEETAIAIHLSDLGHVGNGTALSSISTLSLQLRQTDCATDMVPMHTRPSERTALELIDCGLNILESNDSIYVWEDASYRALKVSCLHFSSYGYESYQKYSQSLYPIQQSSPSSYIIVNVEYSDQYGDILIPSSYSSIVYNMTVTKSHRSSISFILNYGDLLSLTNMIQFRPKTNYNSLADIKSIQNPIQTILIQRKIFTGVFAIEYNSSNYTLSNRSSIILSLDCVSMVSLFTPTIDSETSIVRQNISINSSSEDLYVILRHMLRSCVSNIASPSMQVNGTSYITNLKEIPDVIDFEVQRYDLSEEFDVLKTVWRITITTRRCTLLDKLISQSFTILIDSEDILSSAAIYLVEKQTQNGDDSFYLKYGNRLTELLHIGDNASLVIDALEKLDMINRVSVNVLASSQCDYYGIEIAFLQQYNWNDSMTRTYDDEPPAFGRDMGVLQVVGLNADQYDYEIIVKQTSNLNPVDISLTISDNQSLIAYKRVNVYILPQFDLPTVSIVPDKSLSMCELSQKGPHYLINLHGAIWSDNYEDDVEEYELSISVWNAVIDLSAIESNTIDMMTYGDITLYNTTGQLSILNATISSLVISIDKLNVDDIKVLMTISHRSMNYSAMSHVDISMDGETSSNSLISFQISYQHFHDGSLVNRNISVSCSTESNTAIEPIFVPSDIPFAIPWISWLKFPSHKDDLLIIMTMNVSDGIFILPTLVEIGLNDFVPMDWNTYRGVIRIQGNRHLVKSLLSYMKIKVTSDVGIDITLRNHLRKVIYREFLEIRTISRSHGYNYYQRFPSQVIHISRHDIWPDISKFIILKDNYKDHMDVYISCDSGRFIYSNGSTSQSETMGILHMTGSARIINHILQNVVYESSEDGMNIIACTISIISEKKMSSKELVLYFDSVVDLPVIQAINIPTPITKSYYGTFFEVTSYSNDYYKGSIVCLKGKLRMKSDPIDVDYITMNSEAVIDFGLPSVHFADFLRSIVYIPPFNTNGFDNITIYLYPRLSLASNESFKGIAITNNVPINTVLNLSISCKDSSIKKYSNYLLSDICGLVFDGELYSEFNVAVLVGLSLQGGKVHLSRQVSDISYNYSYDDSSLRMIVDIMELPYLLRYITFSSHESEITLAINITAENIPTTGSRTVIASFIQTMNVDILNYRPEIIISNDNVFCNSSKTELCPIDGNEFISVNSSDSLNINFVFISDKDTGSIPGWFDVIINATYGSCSIELIDIIQDINTVTDFDILDNGITSGRIWIVSTNTKIINELFHSGFVRYHPTKSSEIVWDWLRVTVYDTVTMLDQSAKIPDKSIDMKVGQVASMDIQIKIVHESVKVILESSLTTATMATAYSDMIYQSNNTSNPDITMAVVTSDDAPPTYDRFLHKVTTKLFLDVNHRLEVTRDTIQGSEILNGISCYNFTAKRSRQCIPFLPSNASISNLCDCNLTQYIGSIAISIISWPEGDSMNGEDIISYSILPSGVSCDLQSDKSFKCYGHLIHLFTLFQSIQFIDKAASRQRMKISLDLQFTDLAGNGFHDKVTVLLTWMTNATNEPAPISSQAAPKDPSLVLTPLESIYIGSYETSKQLFPYSIRPMDIISLKDYNGSSVSYEISISCQLCALFLLASSGDSSSDSLSNSSIMSTSFRDISLRYYGSTIFGGNAWLSRVMYLVTSSTVCPGAEVLTISLNYSIGYLDSHVTNNTSSQLNIICLARVLKPMISLGQSDFNVSISLFPLSTAGLNISLENAQSDDISTIDANLYSHHSGSIYIEALSYDISPSKSLYLLRINRMEMRKSEKSFTCQFYASSAYDEYIHEISDAIIYCDTCDLVLSITKALNSLISTSTISLVWNVAEVSLNQSVQDILTCSISLTYPAILNPRIDIIHANDSDKAIELIFVDNILPTASIVFQGDIKQTISFPLFISKKELQLRIQQINHQTEIYLEDINPYESGIVLRHIYYLTSPAKVYPHDAVISYCNRTNGTYSDIIQAYNLSLNSILSPGNISLMQLSHYTDSPTVFKVKSSATHINQIDRVVFHSMNSLDYLESFYIDIHVSRSKIYHSIGPIDMRTPAMISDEGLGSSTTLRYQPSLQRLLRSIPFFEEFADDVVISKNIFYESTTIDITKPTTIISWEITFIGACAGCWEIRINSSDNRNILNSLSSVSISHIQEPNMVEGSFAILYGNLSTAWINANATADEVESALYALDTIRYRIDDSDYIGKILVKGSVADDEYGYTWHVIILQEVLFMSPPAISVDGSRLGGIGATISLQILSSGSVDSGFVFAKPVNGLTIRSSSSIATYYNAPNRYLIISGSSTVVSAALKSLDYSISDSWTTSIRLFIVVSIRKAARTTGHASGKKMNFPYMLGPISPYTANISINLNVSIMSNGTHSSMKEFLPQNAYESKLGPVIDDISPIPMPFIVLSGQSSHYFGIETTTFRSLDWASISLKDKISLTYENASSTSDQNMKEDIFNISVSVIHGSLVARSAQGVSIGSYQSLPDDSSILLPCDATIVRIDGDGCQVINLSGPLTDLNNTIASMMYIPSYHKLTTDLMTVSIQSYRDIYLSSEGLIEDHALIIVDMPHHGLTLKLPERDVLYSIEDIPGIIGSDCCGWLQSMEYGINVLNISRDSIQVVDMTNPSTIVLNRFILRSTAAYQYPLTNDPSYNVTYDSSSSSDLYREEYLNSTLAILENNYTIILSVMYGGLSILRALRFDPMDEHNNITSILRNHTDYSKDIRLHGSLRELNIMLRGLKYIPEANWNSYHTSATNNPMSSRRPIVYDILSISLANKFNDRIDETINIFVAPVNDEPVISVSNDIIDSNLLQFYECKQSNLCPLYGLKLHDEDLYEASNYYEINLQASYGTFNIDKSINPSISSYLSMKLDDNMSSVTLLVPADKFSTALDGLEYVPIPNYRGNDMVIISVMDKGSYGICPDILSHINVSTKYDSLITDRESFGCSLATKMMINITVIPSPYRIEIPAISMPKVFENEILVLDTLSLRILLSSDSVVYNRIYAPTSNLYQSKQFQQLYEKISIEGTFTARIYSKYGQINVPGIDKTSSYKSYVKSSDEVIVSGSYSFLDSLIRYLEFNPNLNNNVINSGLASILVELYQDGLLIYSYDIAVYIIPVNSPPAIIGELSNEFSEVYRDDRSSLNDLGPGMKISLGGIYIDDIDMDDYSIGTSKVILSSKYGYFTTNNRTLASLISFNTRHRLALYSSDFNTINEWLESIDYVNSNLDSCRHNDTITVVAYDRCMVDGISCSLNTSVSYTIDTSLLCSMMSPIWIYPNKIWIISQDVSLSFNRLDNMLLLMASRPQDGYIDLYPGYQSPASSVIIYYVTLTVEIGHLAYDPEFISNSSVILDIPANTFAGLSLSTSSILFTKVISMYGLINDINIALMGLLYVPAIGWNSLANGSADSLHLYATIRDDNRNASAITTSDEINIIAIRGLNIRPPYIKTFYVQYNFSLCVDYALLSEVDSSIIDIPLHEQCPLIDDTYPINITMNSLYVALSDIAVIDEEHEFSSILRGYERVYNITIETSIGALTRSNLIGDFPSNISLIGSVVNINNNLKRLRYTPLTNYYGLDSLRLSLEYYEYGANILRRFNLTIPIAISPISIPPIVSIPIKYYSILEDHKLVMNDISLIDPYIAGDKLSSDTSTESLFTPSSDAGPSSYLNGSQILQFQEYSLYIECSYGSIRVLPYRTNITIISSNNTQRSLNQSDSIEFYRDMIIVGSMYELNLVLSSVVYQPESNWNSNTSNAYDLIRFTIKDDWQASNTEYISIFVLAVNDRPVISYNRSSFRIDIHLDSSYMDSSLQYATQDMSMSLHSFRISDVDSNDDTIVKLNVTVINGMVTIPIQSDEIKYSLSYLGSNDNPFTYPDDDARSYDMYIVTGTGINDTVIIFYASYRIANKVLERLDFIPKTNYYGIDAYLVISVDDLGNYGYPLGVFLSAEYVLRIVVLPSNIPPTISIPSDYNVGLLIVKNGTYERIQGARNRNFLNHILASDIDSLTSPGISTNDSPYDNRNAYTDLGKISYNGIASTSSGFELWRIDLRLYSLLSACDIDDPACVKGLDLNEAIYADIRTGVLSSHPQYFTSYKNMVYFQATDSIYGTEMWTIDNPIGNLSSGIQLLDKDAIFSSERVTSYGSNMKESPQRDTVSLFSDLYPGFASSSPQNLYIHDDILYFTSSGLDLSWMIPYEYQDSCQSFRRSSYDHRIYFAVSQSNIWDMERIYDCPKGYHWANTEEGRRSFPFHSGDSEGLISPNTTESFVYMDQCGWNGLEWCGKTRKYFRFSDSPTTFAYKDAAKPDFFRIEYDMASNIDMFAGIVCVSNEASMELYNNCTDCLGGLELWRTDGSNRGTYRIESSGSNGTGLNPKYLTSLGGYLYFIAYTDEYIQSGRLYRTDGGIHHAQLIDLVGNVDNVYNKLRTDYKYIDPKDMVAVDKYLIFAAYTPDYGRELWRVSFSHLATGEMISYIDILDLEPGSVGSNPQEFTLTNHDAFPVYYHAVSSVYGDELWRSDGTQAGSYIVSDICPGSSGSYPRYLTWHKGYIYFQASDCRHGVELWKSDGTNEGTRMIRDIRPGSGSSCPSHIVSGINPTRSSSSMPYEKFVYFYIHHNDPKYSSSSCEGDNIPRKVQLWMSDGTSQGTFHAFDKTDYDLYIFESIYTRENPYKLFIQDGYLYLSARYDDGQVKYPNIDLLSNNDVTYGISQAAVISDNDTLPYDNVTVSLSVDQGYLMVDYSSIENPAYSPNNMSFALLSSYGDHTTSFMNALFLQGHTVYVHHDGHSWFDTIFTQRLVSEDYDHYIIAEDLDGDWDGLRLIRAIREYETNNNISKISILSIARRSTRMYAIKDELIAAGADYFIVEPSDHDESIDTGTRSKAIEVMNQYTIKSQSSIAKQRAAEAYSAMVNNIHRILYHRCIDLNITITKALILDDYSSLPSAFIGQDITMTGSVIQINRALEYIYFYSANASFIGNVAMNVTVTDGDQPKCLDIPRNISSNTSVIAFTNRIMMKTSTISNDLDTMIRYCDYQRHAMSRQIKIYVTSSR